MTTLENQIELELRNAGFKTTGSYSTLSEIVLNAVLTVQEFGFNYWAEQTSVGRGIKDIVIKLAK